MSSSLPLQERIALARARRDASLPKEYLVNLQALGLQELPDEPIPRPTLPDDPSQEYCPSDLYPSDNVLEIPRTVLPQEDVQITELPTSQLLADLASGSLSAVRCVQAYMRRAVLAQQLVNCVTEMLTDFALQTAKDCDEYLAREGKVKGPLHGLPVSLKDQFHVSGYPTVMGYAAFIEQKQTEHAAITELLLRAGAVPFVHTNVPQTLMRGETDNHVFGRTLNPHNRSFTCGGSSGGEGALIALKGSPLGAGTDIGGSVRIPAAFNGLFSFRPSMHRIPYEGSLNSMQGQESISSVIGPLSSDLDGCIAFVRAVLAEKPWTVDPLAVTKTFDQEAFELRKLDEKTSSDTASQTPELLKDGSPKLCFGIMWDNGLYTPHPPITRALKEFKAKLLAQGHEVVDWVNYESQEAATLVARLYVADGGEDIATVAAAGGEPLMTNVTWPKPSKVPSVYDGWQLNQEKMRFRTAFLKHWQATIEQTGTGRPIDALVCPNAPYAACPHNYNHHIPYTNLWNLVDRPAVTFPVTRVQAELDQAESERETMGLRYDAAKWNGMPVNLQLVGHRMQDEELLGIAKLVCN
ncbi:hypothetical protein OC845_003643 [Tilletia horrida]|nr:hypothetical protein OC845_003643 [Tilletia horrida]